MFQRVEREYRHVPGEGRERKRKNSRLLQRLRKKKKRATERQEETAWARLKEGLKKGRRLKQAS